MHKYTGGAEHSNGGGRITEADPLLGASYGPDKMATTTTEYKCLRNPALT